MSSRTVAIAGAGIIGLATAWRLSQRGWQVTIFDKGSIAGEASWAGAGMLAPGGEIEHDSELSRMLIEARRMYSGFIAELIAETNLTIDYQENGGLDLAYSHEEAIRLEARRTLLTAMGIDSKVLTPGQIVTFWPRVNREHLVSGVFFPEDAVVDPRDVTRALSIACRRRGIQVAEDTGVVGITAVSDRVVVRLPQEQREFGSVVIAAGAWSHSIEVAAPLPPLLEVTPVRGVLLGYHQPAQTCTTILRDRHTYLLQRANGMLIAGASVERAGFDRTITPAVVNDLVAKASQVFPHLGETTPTEIWTGFRPYADAPVIKRWHHPNVFLAYGHYRNGILLAPHTAAQIAEMIETASSGT